MGQFHCDRCGRGLLVDHDVRYEVRIEVKAGFDPPELTRADLERDYREEIRRLLERMEEMDPEALEEQVYALRRYDLCPPCRDEWLGDPLGTGR
ncbi:MAG: hypothetical protein ACYS99_21800 [Planctomycetota bacterium]